MLGQGTFGCLSCSGYPRYLRVITPSGRTAVWGQRG
jgi:hypothetical protein